MEIDLEMLVVYMMGILFGILMSMMMGGENAWIGVPLVLLFGTVLTYALVKIIRDGRLMPLSDVDEVEFNNETIRDRLCAKIWSAMENDLSLRPILHKLEPKDVSWLIRRMVGKLIMADKIVRTEEQYDGHTYG